MASLCCLLTFILCWYGGFCHRTGSDPSLFLLWPVVKKNFCHCFIAIEANRSSNIHKEFSIMFLTLFSFGFIFDTWNPWKQRIRIYEATETYYCEVCCFLCGDTICHWLQGRVDWSSIARRITTIILILTLINCLIFLIFSLNSNRFLNDEQWWEIMIHQIFLLRNCQHYMGCWTVWLTYSKTLCNVFTMGATQLLRLEIS